MSGRLFAKRILAAQGLWCRIQPIPSSEYPTPARRPLNSRMSMARLKESGIQPMPSVENALGRYLQELALEKME